MILFLEPYFEKKPWGGNRLKKIYDCKDQTGEAWIVSGYSNKSSIIKNGEFKGKTLRHLWNKNPELFGDFKEKEFPVLLKLIDAKDDLSVQVHPNDDYALKKKNQLGKFECWYILKENEAKDVTLGVNCKNTLELKNAINSNAIASVLRKKEIVANDLIVVDPGRVHALHAGSFVLEAQESSDITYRLYDYDRMPRRELHIEDSLNVIRYDNDKNLVHSFLKEDSFDNEHFKIEKIFVEKNKTIENESFSIFYILEGSGKLNNTLLKKGDTFICTKDKSQVLEFSGEMELIMVVPHPKKKERLKMRKTALITGITGQDGYYLTKLLLEKNYEVHGLIQSFSQIETGTLKEFISDDLVKDKTFFLHIGDLTDSSNINRMIESIRPDEIYHLASQSHVDLSYEIPEITANVNALGTLRILDAIKQSDLRCKMFNLSTSQLFSGKGEESQDETTPFEPQNPYATSKLYSIYISRNYRDSYGLFICNGIFFNHESSLRSEKYVTKKITNAVKQIAAGSEKILTLGNLDSKRDWGYAPDFVEAMWLMLQQDKPDDYVIATNEIHTVREFVEESFKQVGINIVWQGKGIEEKGIDSLTGKTYVTVDYNYFRINDASYLKGNYEKAKRILNWEPKVKFKELISIMMK